MTTRTPNLLDGYVSELVSAFMRGMSESRQYYLEQDFEYDLHLDIYAGMLQVLSLVDPEAAYDVRLTQ